MTTSIFKDWLRMQGAERVTLKETEHELGGKTYTYRTVGIRSADGKVHNVTREEYIDGCLVGRRPV